MQIASRAGLVAITLLATACSFSAGTGNAGNMPPPSHHHHNAPPPAAPPPTPAQPAVANAVAPQPAPSAQNVQRIQAIVKRSPKACGYMEMSPGNWVHVDCHRYKASVHAVPHLSPRKAKVYAQHKQLFKPIHHLVIKPKTPQGTGGVVSPTDNGGGQVSENFPSSIDHRALNLESPVKNQGQVGSCTAHSLSAALDNAAIRAGRLKVGDSANEASPIHVWSRYGQPDMGAAADGNISQPVGPLSIWPQSDTDACKIMQNNGDYADECGEVLGVKPGSWQSDPVLMKKYNDSQSHGLYKIAAVEKLDSPVQINDMISVLATGADLWVAMQVDTTAWSNRSMKNAVIPDWTRDSGGHAIVISGYRDTGSGKQFMIHNSWGASWGDGGYAWISEAMVNKYMYYAYQVKITNPVPKDQLTDDDCAPDELVDLGTGLCAPMCGDNRPNNGCH
jgi:hypothetical protein